MFVFDSGHHCITDFKYFANYIMEHDLPWVTLLPHECEATSGIRKALRTDRAPLLLLYDGYIMNDFFLVNVKKVAILL